MPSIGAAAVTFAGFDELLSYHKGELKARTDAGAARVPIDRVTSCVTRGHGVTCSYDFGFLSNSVIHTIEVFVTPNDKEYGGDNYGGRGKNGRRQTMSIGPFEF